MKYFDLASYKSSRIAQGCMRIASLTDKEIDTLIKTDIDCGINFFDHADIYGGGECERRFGEFLKSNPSLKDKIIIQTKCAITNGYYDFSKEHIISSVEGSLSRLGIDSVDFLLLHRPDTLMEPCEVAEAFELLSTQGKVKCFGVSNQNPMQIQLLQKYLGNIKLHINQLQLSITNTGIIDSGLNVNTEKCEAADRDGYVLDFCRLNDITIQPWSPLQHGFFGGTFINNPDYSELNKKLNEIGEKYGITATSTAILWLLRHSACMQPIIGTVNTDRIRDICKGADCEMSRKEWYELYKSTGKTLP